MALRSDVAGLAREDGPTPAEPRSGEAEPPRVFLSTTPAGKRERRAALVVTLLSVAAFATAVPFARLPLTPVPAFIPAYEASLIIIDVIAAIYLLGQYVQLRSRALFVLALGYLFDGLMIVPHALTFPGLFAPSGLLGAGSQSTAWLYMFWHGGFPIFVMSYAALEGRSGAGKPPPARGRADAVVGILAVVVAVVALTLLATAGQGVLPNIMQGSHYTPAMKFVVSTVWALSLAALLALWRRRPFSVLDLWLSVVMCAWLFDIALSAVLNAGRFDLGFYAGRVYGLMAASFVLVVLLLQTSGLYSRMVQDRAQLEDQARRLERDVRDRIATQRQIEAQLWQAQKMEAIGTLTGGMAHDFNNLLAVIIGNLDILFDSKGSDAEVRELAGAARDAALRGADLTHRLLAFARRQPLQPQRIEVNALIEDVAKLLRRTLGANVEISLDLAPSLWPVIADPAQLEASLANLATNARDAMPNGGRLTIVTANRYLDAEYAMRQPEMTAGDYALIEVSDTGCGMTPEVRSRIFEPFFTTKDLGKGSGLGLSMVFGFMKQSGGHINVYSEPGIGTTIRLYLPRAAADVEAVAEAAAAQVVGGQGELVLAVEDDASLRQVTVRQLRELGYRVVEADNAAAAIAALERDAVDILFTDVMMPGATTGIELARAASARWPALRVVLTSGFPDFTLGKDIGLSAMRLLGKPYRKDDLARALRQALDR